MPRILTPPLKNVCLKALAALDQQFHTPKVVNMAEDRNNFADEINKALAKSEGLTLKELLFSYRGTPYPATVCSVETFQALENLEARRDDMVLVSYPKCGEYIINLLL